MRQQSVFLADISLPFLDGYCSTVQGLLHWFEVDLGFTELLFIQIDLCVMCAFGVCRWAKNYLMYDYVTKELPALVASLFATSGTLQHTAIHCNTLQHTGCIHIDIELLSLLLSLLPPVPCNTLQHTATHCNALQHTATHCNTCDVYT